MKGVFSRIACISAFAALILLATIAHAGDDTARFYGTWKATVVLNGQTVTVISVHDAGGFKNYVQTATGPTPVGDGTFMAANGKWSSNAPFPNNGGLYHFLNNDTVVTTNAAGQTATWTRDKAAEAAAAKGPRPWTRTQPRTERPGMCRRAGVRALRWRRPPRSQQSRQLCRRPRPNPPTMRRSRPASRQDLPRSRAEIA